MCHCITTPTRLFSATDVVLMITPTHKQYKTAADITSLIPSKTEGGVFDNAEHIRLLIIAWFGDATFIDSEEITSKLRLLRQRSWHSAVITESKELRIYEKYKLGHALLLAEKLIRNRENPKVLAALASGVMIYLEETDCAELSYWFEVTHNANETNLNLYIVSQGVTRPIGEGVLLMNNDN